MLDQRIIDVWDREVLRMHAELKAGTTEWATTEVLRVRRQQINDLEFAIKQRQLARGEK